MISISVLPYLLLPTFLHHWLQAFFNAVPPLSVSRIVCHCFHCFHQKQPADVARRRTAGDTRCASNLAPTRKGEEPATAHVGCKHWLVRPLSNEKLGPATLLSGASVSRQGAGFEQPRPKIILTSQGNKQKSGGGEGTWARL